MRDCALERLTNGKRLWAGLMEMAAIGATGEGGCFRLALDAQDRRARDLFVARARAAGCRISIDPYGNIFAIRPGHEPDRAAILSGSHLDTQPHGGRFDGVLGVMAALEVIEALNDSGLETVAPVVAVNWTNEEGVRFKPGLTGSAGWARNYARPLPEAAIRSESGVDFFEELARIGYAGEDHPPTVGAYLELHIEQGPRLELAGVPVGVVTGIQGVRWLELACRGIDAHAGTTPIADRSDSFLAAARFVVEATSLATALNPEIRLTAGQVDLSPNSVNTVAGFTRATLDLRHRDEAMLDRIEAELGRLRARISGETGVELTIDRVMTVPPVGFHPELVSTVTAAADMIGLPSMELHSGAMHDASSLAQVVPTGMIFVPSRGGISHHPAEWTAPEEVADGCEVLCRAILELAGVGAGKVGPAALAKGDQPA